MPPVDALLGWVQRHFHAPRARVNQNTLRGEAFALARAIARRGIPPRPFMLPAYEHNRARITAAFARLGLRTVAYWAGNPLWTGNP
jgi:hypothetical protein